MKPSMVYEGLLAWDRKEYKKFVTEIYSSGTQIGSALVPSPLYFSSEGFCYFLGVRFAVEKEAALCSTHSNPPTSSSKGRTSFLSHP